MVRLRHVLCWKKDQWFAQVKVIRSFTFAFESPLNQLIPVIPPTTLPDPPDFSRHLEFWVNPDFASVPSLATQHNPGAHLPEEHHFNPAQPCLLAQSHYPDVGSSTDTPRPYWNWRMKPDPRRRGDKVLGRGQEISGDVNGDFLACELLFVDFIF